MFLYVVWINEIPFDPQLFEICRTKYKEISSKIGRSKKMGKLENLGPSLIYMLLKSNGINLKMEEMIDNFEIDYISFLSLVKEALPYYPEYRERDKLDFIKNRVLKIQEHFSFPDEFVLLCEKLFGGYYPILQYTKEDLVVSILSTLSYLLLGIKKANITQICSFAGSPLSSVTNFVKKQIFADDPSQFHGFQASKDVLIERLLRRLRSKKLLQDFSLQTAQKPHSKPNPSPKKTNNPSNKNNTSNSLTNTQRLRIIKFHIRNEVAENIATYFELEKDQVLSVIYEYNKTLGPALLAQLSKECLSLTLTYNPFPAYGKLQSVQDTHTKCEICGHPIYQFSYPGKKVFFCETCYKES